MKRTFRQKAAMAWVGMPGIVRVGIVLALAIVVVTCAGCGGTLPVIPARTAIPVECKEPIPESPAMPTDNLTDQSTLDASVAAMAAEIEVRKGYETELVTALKACTKPINH